MPTVSALSLQVACGLNHTLVVSADGMMVWAFGDGDYGKLGLGNSTAKSSPQVSFSSKMKKKKWVNEVHLRTVCVMQLC